MVWKGFQMTIQITSSDRDFLGENAPSAGNIQNDPDFKRAVSSSLKRHFPNDKSLQIRAFQKIMTMEDIPNTRTNAFKNTNKFAVYGADQVLMDRLRYSKKQFEDNREKIRSSNKMSGEARQPWDLESLKHIDAVKRPKAVNLLVSENISRNIEPNRLIAGKVEKVAGAFGLDYNDPAKILQPEFLDILNNEDLSTAISENSRLIDSLANSQQALTAVQATAIARGDESLSNLINAKIAGNIDAIPMDSIDADILSRFDSLVDAGNPQVQQYVFELTSTDQHEDIYTKILDASYGGGLHAIAKRNLIKLSDFVLIPLFAEIGVDSKSVQYLHSQNSLRNISNVAAVFDAGGISSHIVINHLKNMVEDSKIEIGLACEMSSKTVMVTLPFYHYGVYIKNFFTTI